MERREYNTLIVGDTLFKIENLVCYSTRQEEGYFSAKHVGLTVDKSEGKEHCKGGLVGGGGEICWKDDLINRQNRTWV